MVVVTRLAKHNWLAMGDNGLAVNHAEWSHKGVCVDICDVTFDGEES